MYVLNTGIKGFGFWCQKVLPLVYDDSLSYYEVLCKLKAKLNEVIDQMNQVSDQVNKNTTAIQEIRAEILQINNWIQQIEQGNFPDAMWKALENWVNANGERLVAQMVKFISFGLTGDGYFCALVPKTWEFIDFDTVVDPASPLDGHLVLRWG